MNKLEKTLNFNSTRNKCSETAYSIIKSIKESTKHFNPNHLDINELNFEFENYFYNESLFPAIDLKENVEGFEDILNENGFEKKYIEIEGKELTYYENVKDNMMKIKDNKLFYEKTFTDRLDKVFIEGLFGLSSRSKYDQRFSIFSQIFRSHNIMTLSFYSVFHEDFIKYFESVVNSLEKSPKFKLRNAQALNDYIIKYLIENYNHFKKLSAKDTELAYTEIPVNGYFIPTFLVYDKKDNKDKTYKFVAAYSFGTYEIDGKLYIVPYELYWSKKSLRNEEIVKKVRKNWNAVYFS